MLQWEMWPATSGRDGFFPTSKPHDLSQGRTLKQEFGGYLHICLHSVFFMTPVFQSMHLIPHQTENDACK